MTTEQCRKPSESCLKLEGGVLSPPGVRAALTAQRQALPRLSDRFYKIVAEMNDPHGQRHEY
jgi:hypothetical protein